MARRRRTGAAEDIIDLTALLPWWAGVALASIRQYLRPLLPLLCLIGAAADGEKLLVQCKHWKAYKVGMSVVRELFGLMGAKGAAGGFVVTSGRCTQEAKDFATGGNIRLVDGEALFALIQSVRKTKKQHWAGVLGVFGVSGVPRGQVGGGIDKSREIPD